jgi:4-hydroxy-2-oxoheptanedioate aldolase
MSAPINTFKKAMAAGETQYGCWLSMADAGAAEMIGTTGFDWVLIDGEHSPNDIRSIRDQLIALQASNAHTMVRVPMGETWLIKQVLDVGAQTVMVPMVESAEQARELVRACTYPPGGKRGVGATAARATQFGAISDYIATADAQICLLVQVESRAGIAALDEILTVEGVDGVFIGPSDLSTDMGFSGNVDAPEVQDTIRDALGRIAAAGKAPGIMSLGEGTPAYVDAGAQFIAVAIDVLLLVKAARATVAKWKTPA